MVAWAALSPVTTRAWMQSWISSFRDATPLFGMDRIGTTEQQPSESQVHGGGCGDWRSFAFTMMEWRDYNQGLGPLIPLYPIGNACCRGIIKLINRFRRECSPQFNCKNNQTRLVAPLNCSMKDIMIRIRVQMIDRTDVIMLRNSKNRQKCHHQS